ncbi:BTAD domain-containing putative transcriptional regulator [Amycolatopsis anabasis]|uniref:BTAD domain-containing putative transcriptional regulator n=1 Tax=Amycolatopsis anabasis TaxID=1840409 RepID=UPI00131DAD6C|nr:BTAD domain-containing putative transcriptional regulator [Amycolatopsis anabasis]
MRFGVLGPLVVWTADGSPVRVPEAKVRALLADLLVHEGRPVSADRLAADLWGERLPGNPANTLQTKVSQLRRAFEAAEPGGRELVTREAAGYALRIEADAVDADRFRALTTRARQTADPAARSALLADALALWRGPAFADFADDPFAAAAIQRLAEEHLAAQEEWAQARLELGEHAALAGELGELVARHPLRERLRAVYVRALYRSGRQSEALASLGELRARLSAELGLDPGPELTALQQAILVQDPALDATAEPRSARNRHNLPAPLTELVGRAEGVREVRARLAANRLVTLSGPGGVGKTRLAVESARQLLEAYPDGVWLVELAGVGKSGAADLARALAQTVLAVLDIREDTAPGPLPPGTPVDPGDRLTSSLRGKRMLLVLDNCEHVVTAVAELADRLLSGVEGLRILATSQEALGLPGEALFPVPPLDLPARAAEADPDAVREAGAVRLFAARAAAAAPGFRVDRDNAAAVAAICRRLDGIPLALELAATRVRALGVPELLSRLDDRFALLGSGRRGVPARQQTLRAMIDWSWELLTGAERAVLRRLAVHLDGCTLDAAESVCAGEGVDRSAVLDLLARLVDRSLVVMTADRATGEPRYRLLESVAAYCLERMAEAGEENAVRERHAEYYVALAERADPLLRGHEQRRWLLRLDAEAPNLRAALEFALRRPAAGTALRLVNGLLWYWFLRGRLSEADCALADALAVPGDAPPDARAKAASWRSAFALLGKDTADRNRDGWREIGDPGERARARWFLNYALATLGDLAALRAAVDAELAEFAALGDRWGVAAALADRANQAVIRGEFAAGARDARRSDEMFAELGDRWGRVQVSFILGTLAEVTGDYSAAERRHTEGLGMAEELGLWPEVSYQLSWLGRVALLTRDFDRARELHERAAKLAAEQGFAPGEMYAETGLALGARREGRFDLAEKHLRTVLRWNRQVEFEPGNTLILAELGFLAEQRGDAESARKLQLDGFEIARRIGDPRAIALALEGLAGATALAGAHGNAARLLGAAAASRASVGAPLPEAERGDVARIEAVLRKALGVADFAAEFEQGERLTPEEARALVGP